MTITPQNNELNNRLNSTSASRIANYVALNASLSLSLQLSTNILPGNVNRYNDNGGLHHEHLLASSIAFHKPVMDISTRGIMVNFNFIDMDEVDMGWIMAESLKENKQWHKGPNLNLGSLAIYLPIAAAAAYLFSTNPEITGYKLNNNELQRLTMEFLENTTPEDTVQLFTQIYNSDILEYQIFKSFSSTLNDGVEIILDSALNLLDFYKIYRDDILVFNEISNSYPTVFGSGMSAFSEALSEGLSLIDSITHTYLHVLATHVEPFIVTLNGKSIAYSIKRQASEIVDYGGYITKKGRKMAKEMDMYIRNLSEPIHTHSISDITNLITFIATLNGIRP